MGNALNVRILNNINTISQGDSASTIQIELLDENKLTLPELNGESALINFVVGNGEIVYQVNTAVFDSRVEFNIGAVLPYGKYTLEIIIAVEGYTYIFPSNGKTVLNVNKSSSHYYTVAIESIGPEVVAVDVINRIRGEFPGALEHSALKNNPHDVTAEQVGLGQVPDWTSATQAEAEVGSLNNRFMTPIRTKQAIDAQIPIEDRERWDSSASVQYVEESISNLDIPDHEPYDNHLSSTDNPHNVTKSQVGLGNVPNYPMSTQSIAEEGIQSEYLMSPVSTKQAIEAQVPVNDFTSHMEDSDVHVSPEDRSNWDSKATQTDIDNTLASMDMPNKANFEQAIDGTDDSTYMTPFRVHQKVTEATENYVQIVDYVLEFPNPDVADATGGAGYYRTIPNFGESVTIMTRTLADIPKGTVIAKVIGEIEYTKTLTANVLGSNLDVEREIFITVSRSTGEIKTSEDVEAGKYIVVEGVFQGG